MPHSSPSPQTTAPDPTAPEPAIPPAAETGTATPQVSVIVISYNTREMTLECLQSLRDETRADLEVIVVDNASTDGSAEAIAEAFPEMRLMAEQDNHGFAGANNLAAKQARGTYILLLNPDTVVLDGAVDKLLAFAAQKPDARIWGGRTLYGDRSLNPTSCWGRMTLWNLFCRASGLTGVFSGSPLFNSEAYGNWPRDSVRAVDIVTGCFLLIRRDLWQELDGFDPTFFMYGEEADLCLRARALGADPHVTPDASIVHYGGASEKVRADKMVRLLSGKMSLVDRHFPAWQKPLAKTLFRAWPLSRLIATRVLGTLTGKQALKDSADTWAEVWNRRAAWKDGYQTS